jgi:hypothetical protein
MGICLKSETPYLKWIPPQYFQQKNAMNTPFSLKTLVRIDASAAFSSAVFMFSLKGFLAPFLNVPMDLLIIQAAIGSCYACFSFYLTQQQKIPKSLLKTLVVANCTYALLCCGFMVWFFKTASIWGIGFFIFDAVIVALLAFLENQQLKICGAKLN